MKHQILVGAWSLALVLVHALGCDTYTPPVLGRCATRVDVQDQIAREALMRAFNERYGPTWEVSAIEPFARFVVLARATSVQGQGQPGEVTLTAEEASAVARAHLARGADLFGLSPEIVATLDELGAWNPDSPLIQWNIDFAGAAPVPGYEALFPDTRNEFRLSVDIDFGGKPTLVSNRSRILPPINICQTPLLTPDSPRLRRNVVGRELSFTDIRGQLVEVGRVRQENITDTTLVLHVDRRDPNALTVQLAYRLDVSVDLLSWSFFVDPDTGRLLEVRQNFRT